MEILISNEIEYNFAEVNGKGLIKTKRQIVTGFKPGYVHI